MSVTPPKSRKQITAVDLPAEPPAVVVEEKSAPEVKPPPKTYRRGMKVARETSGSRSGLAGQKHQLELSGVELVSSDDAAKKMTKLLGSRVKLPSEAVIKARLYALVPDQYAREKLVDQSLLPRLAKRAGHTCTLAELLEVCSESKGSATKGLGRVVASMMDEQMMGPSLRLAAGILDDPTPLAQLSLLSLEASRKESAPIEELRALLARAPEAALRKISAQVPRNAELVADLLEGMRSGKVDHFEAEEVVQKFGIAALPVLRAELESNDLGRVGFAALFIGSIGRIAGSAIDGLANALAFVANAPEPEDGRFDPKWARERIFDALASLGGERLLQRDDGVAAVKAELESGNRERIDVAARILSQSGAGALPLIPVLRRVTREHHALAQVLGGLGAAAWPVIPDLLARGDWNLWFAIEKAVGKPPASAARAMAAQVMDGAVYRSLLDPLRSAANKVRDEVAALLVRSWDDVRGDRPSAVSFVALAADAHPAKDPKRKAAIAFLERELASEHRDVAQNAYWGLLKLLPAKDADAVTKKVFEDPKIRTWARFELIHGAISKDAKRAAAFTKELEQLAGDVGEAIGDRDRAREVLGVAREKRAELLLTDLLASERIGFGDLDLLKKLVDASTWPSTLVHFVEEGGQAARFHAAYELKGVLERAEPYDAAMRKIAERLVAAAEKHADVAQRLGWELDSIREALAS